MGTEENRQAVLDAMAAFTRGDMERYLSLYDPSARLHGYTPEPLDHDGIVAFYASFGQSFTNASPRSARSRLPRPPSPASHNVALETRPPQHDPQTSRNQDRGPRSGPKCGRSPAS
jgi:hypothetical protein